MKKRKCPPGLRQKDLLVKMGRGGHVQRTGPKTGSDTPPREAEQEGGRGRVQLVAAEGGLGSSLAKETKKSPAEAEMGVS